MRQAVHQFKYKNLRAAAEPLAELLWSYLKDNPVEGDILVPVPLYGKRLRERGYNQSALLARELSRLSGAAAGNELPDAQPLLIPAGKGGVGRGKAAKCLRGFYLPQHQS